MTEPPRPARWLVARPAGRICVDEAVGLYRELADVGPDDRLAKRQALPYSFEDELYGATKYIGEASGVLAGDKIAISREPHASTRFKFGGGSAEISASAAWPRPPALEMRIAW